MKGENYGSNMKFTKEKIDKIYKLFFEEKISQEKIAKEMKIGCNTLSKFLKEQNWKRDPINQNRNVIDEVGKRYGKLVVLERDFNYRKEHNIKSTGVYWKCKCDCGNETTVLGNALRNGSIRSCGCLQKELLSERCKNAAQNLVGQRFGKLVVLERDYEYAIQKKLKNQGIYWKCKCDCGNITSVATNKLKNGETKSCGCYRKEQMSSVGKQQNFKDYTQVENPFYSFIEPTDEIGNCGRIWKTQCKKCGKYYFTVPSQTVSGKRTHGNNPCNCWRATSKGVLYIRELLLQNNISFCQEQKFEDCLSPKGNNMKFDFYVNNKYLIEYDGEQHFKPIAFHNNQTVNTIKQFVNQQLYDKIKNEYCLNNNIPLIRIPYTHYGSIVLEDLIPETSTFLVKGDENIE